MQPLSAPQSPFASRLRTGGAAAASTATARSAPTPFRSVLGADELLLSPSVPGIGPVSTGNQVQLHVTPEETRQALLQAIRDARSSFHIETFIWKDDEAGREIARALVERKRLAEERGEPFDAKVLVDSLGMRDQPKGGSFKNIQAILEAGGVEVRIFNPAMLSLSAGGVPITHRKLYIADGQSFITGGRNLADEYLKDQFGPKGENAWHDLAYTVSGPETKTISKLFFENWVKSGGKAPATLPEPSPVLGGGASIRTIVTDPVKDLRGIRQAHSEAIAKAQREIVAIYPYLTDDRQIEDLIKAKRANPQLSIKVMIPGVAEGGLFSIFPIIHMESARQLIEAGIEVRLYHGEQVNGQNEPRYLHLKAMLIDDELLSLGSANGDARTFTSNYELNTLIQDAGTVADFRRRVIDPDWAAADPLTRDEVKLPFFKRLFSKILEWFDFLL